MGFDDNSPKTHDLYSYFCHFTYNSRISSYIKYSTLIVKSIERAHVFSWGINIHALTITITNKGKSNFQLIGFCRCFIICLLMQHKFEDNIWLVNGEQSIQIEQRSYTLGTHDMDTHNVGHEPTFYLKCIIQTKILLCPQITIIIQVFIQDFQTH